MHPQKRLEWHSFMNCTLEGALHWAVGGNDRRKVEELLGNGANVNAVAPDGSTVLRVALINRYAGLIGFLRRKGATVLGRETLFDAAQQGDVDEIQRSLEEHPDVVCLQDGDGWTLLHWAAYGESAEVAARLIMAALTSTRKATRT